MKTSQWKIVLAVSLTIAAAATLSSQISSSEMQNQPIQYLSKPRIVIKKGERKLEIYDGRKLIKIYTVVLGFSAEGDKELRVTGELRKRILRVTKNPEPLSLIARH